MPPRIDARGSRGDATARNSGTRRCSGKTYIAHGEPWFGFRCVRKLGVLPPEILIVPLVGHTLGHCSVAVRDGAGWLLHAGDAYYFRGETPQGDDAAKPPHCTPGLRFYQRFTEADRTSRLLNQERLRELAAYHACAMRIVSGHDAVELERACDERRGRH